MDEATIARCESVKQKIGHFGVFYLKPGYKKHNSKWTQTSSWHGESLLHFLQSGFRKATQMRGEWSDKALQDYHMYQWTDLKAWGQRQ